MNPPMLAMPHLPPISVRFSTSITHSSQFENGQNDKYVWNAKRQNNTFKTILHSICFWFSGFDSRLIERTNNGMPVASQCVIAQARTCLAFIWLVLLLLITIIEETML